MLHESVRKKEQENHCGFTGTPEINNTSRAINRKVDDLFNWDQQRKSRIETLQMLKEEEES